MVVAKAVSKAVTAQWNVKARDSVEVFMSTDFGIMTLMLPICVLIGGRFMQPKSTEPVVPPRCGDEYRALIALVLASIAFEESLFVGE